MREGSEPVGHLNPLAFLGFSYSLFYLRPFYFHLLYLYQLAFCTDRWTLGSSSFYSVQNCLVTLPVARVRQSYDSVLY